MESTESKARSSSDTGIDQITPQQAVNDRYEELLMAQESSPDKVFISGFSLRSLDPNLVVLDEEKNEHPRSWTFSKKAGTTAIIGAFGFLSPFASTIFAPSVHLLMDDLHITDSTVGALQVSVFLFAYAVGPLFLAPLSEMYGRAIIINGGNIVFVIFSIGGGFSKTPTQFIVTRFLAGLGGSSAIAVIGGVVADIWNLEARPKASGAVMLGPILGPILGPVCGGWMSQLASWRWTLWVPAIASGLLAAFGMIFLPETYAPRILQKKLRRERAPQTNGHLYTVLNLQPHPSSLGFLLSQFIRPIVYLILDPALLLASIFYSVIFGVIYLVIVTYSDVFGLGYHHSVGIVGTDFLAVGIGMVIGTIVTVKVMETIFKKDAATGQVKYKPESRLISCIIGAIVTAGGLFLYGFTALKTHFIIPLVGMAVFSIGAMNIMMAIQLYTIDGFQYPASAFAAISVLRCIFAGAFPLFGPKLFESLGINWGVALLAFLVLGVGLPLVMLLYVFGPRLRKTGVGRLERFEGNKEK
ncbi:MFS general substrate transporter [Lindgomyces ingoldianus]|uniref:MFS general substrate transporter n=1 Tax=Lindgomyces ingoldianus TaxID=673940 RepID=A0ACB6QLQ8_9PLEO|nr:MFS general substrate transporter [Lindgomyces ingoldianus]KAF2467807.1 MFS general substrate transporter [Lindgomyces ingoldianus]